MAAPALIPILKKVASAVVSNKKLRKVAVGIALGTLFLTVLPVLALLGIFSGSINIDLDNVDKIIQQQQATAQTALTEIESAMTEDGYSAQRIEEAQALYALVFFSGKDEVTAEDFVECLSAEQTDEQMLDTVNSKFKTAATAEQYAEAVREIREKYEDKENNTAP